MRSVTKPCNTTGLLLGGLVLSALLLCEKLTQASGKLDIQGEEGEMMQSTVKYRK